MTEGISKENLEKKLIEYHRLHCKQPDQAHSNGMIDMIELLIDDCKELDPWLPIADAPKDQEIIGLVMYGGEKCKKIIRYGHILKCWVDDLGDPVDAIQYKLLPEDPKE